MRSDRPDLTLEQRRAVETRHVSVALSAGAGCGKTFVLTERYLFHLGELGAEGLGRLLAITFTDAAAREMRDRIRRNCNQRLLTASDEGEVQRWQALLRELEAARVSTIHSFCAALLRTHAVEAGLDPRFETLDATAQATLLAGLLDDHLRARLAGQDQDVTELVIQFGLDGTREVLTAALARRDQMDFAHWAARSADELLDMWAKFHRQAVLPTVLEQFLGSPSVTTLIDLLRDYPPESETLLDRRAVLLDLLPRLDESTQLASDLATIRENAQVRGRSKNDWPDPAIYDQIKETKEQLRKSIDDLLTVVTFDPAAARPAAEMGLKLVRAAAPLAAAYEQEKRERGVLDFDDLLLHARRLLCGPESTSIRERVAGQIDMLLVDESQDTDPLQVELIEALCGDRLAAGKLFVVGDYKQSIYRFRRADPKVFRNLRNSIPDEGRLPLTENFRSQPAILDFVNALFGDALGPDYERLRPHRMQVSPLPAVEFLWAAPEPIAGEESAGTGGEPARETPEKEGAPARRRREAQWIARRLRGLLDAEAKIVWDAETARIGRPAPRALRRDDIAILFRSLSDVAIYEAALREQGLDYYLVGGTAFYAQQEIFDLLNLLRSLASPLDEVALAGALRSPFFGLADETLYWLVRRRGGLAAGLFAADRPPQLDAREAQRVGFAAETLKDLRLKKDRMPVAALIQEALARTGYDAVLLAEFLGERKLANLRKLVDQARSLDRAGLFTLDDFITQLAEFVAHQPREPLAATHPEGTDVVRLMTIHQAKGLEFPLVVVPDLERKPPPDRGKFAFRPELGPLVRLKEDEDGQELGTSGYDLHSRIEKLEDNAETVRLLYVAATRAADYLMLSAGVGDVLKPEQMWRKLLADRFHLDTGQCKVDLPEGWDTPQVRVTTTEPLLAGPLCRGPRRRNAAEVVQSARDAAAAGRVRIPPSAGPIPADPAARRQYSFSRLSGALRKTAPPKDDEAAGGGGPLVDPLELGHLVHECLAGLPLGQPVDVGQLVQARARKRGRESADEVREARQMIERFLASLRAADLAAARQVHRELEFLLAWPPATVGNAPRGVPKGSDKHRTPQRAFPAGAWQADGLYLQGYFDCLYQDRQGRWRLLDYKTNQVSEATLAEVASRYEMQMLVYGLAIERSFGQPPLDMTLHFLRTGQEVTYQLDVAARERALELVNQAREGMVERVVE